MGKDPQFYHEFRSTGTAEFIGSCSTRGLRDLLVSAYDLANDE